MTFASLARRLAFVCVLLPVLAHAAPRSVPVLLLSDIHFDPYRDPAKFPQLMTSPVERWPEIFAAPVSATQVSDYSKLSQACSVKGTDADWPLLQSALHAAHDREAHPAFITLSGDLSVHHFECQFHRLAPKGTPAELSAFAAKVVGFVTGEIRHTFPGTPVFLTLGNNDSGCEDYGEDIDSAYLQADGAVVAEAALTKADAARVRHEYGPEGDYAVPLPRPFAHTRLLVLQDIFQSAKYRPCSGASPKHAGAEAQLAWLRHELHQARARHEGVWLMAHIPPGVDVYSTTVGKRDVCGGDAPVNFLGDNSMAELLAEYASTVKLALFAHTHMDEMRLFRSPDGKAAAPAKLVPSISAANGNRPVFMLGWADPETGTLVDYSMVVAADNSGSAWHETYRYSTTYHQPDFSGASVSRLMDKLTAGSVESTSYRTFYSAGDSGIRALALGLAWKQYACSLTHSSAAEYRACSCGGAKK